MTTGSLFEQAQLAEASYADLWDEGTNSLITNLDDVQDALIAYSFSEKQAQEFTQNWEVISHQPDTVSGFSATLFRRKTNDPISGYEAGEYVYSIRGSWKKGTDLF